MLRPFLLAALVALAACAGQHITNAGSYVDDGTGDRLVPSDCLRLGLPVPQDNWPGDDGSLPRTMPPGCAVANALQQMVVDKRDLLRGRRLPPGAALPVARAIERYYNEGNGPFGTDTAPTPALGPGTSAPATLPPGGLGAAADGAGLLQGPLTPSGAGAAPPAASTTAGQ